ncbi:UDP-N-acetylglucosamine 2-epimerase [Streptomyces hydrogenans]|uniref:UDP-N-acetylglucosamine 2-epimerase n=1 Tax=Streptomyces hydrogenans TaxID=1873719 RepID=UPI0037FE5053
MRSVGRALPRVSRRRPSELDQSHNRAIPDEHNRARVDRLADVLCAATPANRELLLAQGIPEHRIHVTGNTVVETICAHLPPREEREAILARYGLVRDGYLLTTVHRPEHTDDPRSSPSSLPNWPVSPETSLSSCRSTPAPAPASTPSACIPC